ncbi:hypothetical protein BJX63DRAFT_426274 [Aspergillus granulosus]|uniref:NACHT domain-containing protein n=1 Tax=Aspergillus granulosus TaxID=176169 RepID=A0ABR4GST4_9EURO
MPVWKDIKGPFKKRLPGGGKSSKQKDDRPADNLPKTGSELQLEGNNEASLRILKSNFGLKIEDDGNTGHVNDLRMFLDVAAQRLDDQKWTKLMKASQNILLLKDVVNPPPSPAAIACAGQLFIQAMGQHEILLQGLDLISSLIPRLHVIEHHFLRCDTDLSADLRRTLEKDMIQLYSKVLEFQSRAICYLEKRTARQFFTDMLKKDGWDEIIQDIQRYDTYIKDATSSMHVSEVDKKLEALQDALQQIQVWQTTSAQDSRRAILYQLLYVCPYKDRKDRNNKRVPGTCEWFTSHPQFINWNQSGNSELLWVSADPGCGKSVLTRYLADEYLPSGGRTVCYFFFKDDSADQKRATDALASIIRQLLIARPYLVQDSLLDKLETSGNQLVESFNELWNILVHVTADENAGEVICLLDALDECHEDDRKQLIQAIESLFLTDLGKRNMKFLMTSRPYDHIRRDFFRLEKSLPTIRLSGENEENIEKISSEIDLVIKQRVREIGELNNLQSGECDFISDQLTSVTNRTYLWVILTLDVVERMPGFSRGNVRHVIHDLPEDVDAAYTRILDRSPDHLKARKLLHIVIAAERPLTIEEMSLALALGEEDQSIDGIRDDIPTDDERTQRMIRTLCGLFLVVIDAKIYLLHLTAKEFLVKTNYSIHEDTKVHGLRSKELGNTFSASFYL